KLPELSDEDHTTEEISTPTLIVRQLRWLDYILDPERLTNQLMEIHSAVAKELVGLFEEQSNLTVPVLDALSNLQCPVDLIDTMRQRVLERLRSADTEDLPVMIKFLFQTATSEDAIPLISRIRKNLDLASLRPPEDEAVVLAVPRGTAQPEALILDAINFGLQFHKFIRDGWLKLIAALATPESHYALDIMVLCLLYGIASTRKRVQLLLRRKLMSQQLTAAPIREALERYGRALQQQFPTLLSLTENLMRLGTQSPTIATVALDMYQACFTIFDAYFRQEVVGALVTHIGSGDSCEIDTSLAALQAITLRSPAAMRPYAIFIRGILDYIDNLNFDQVRLLFSILGLL
ncbi:Fanconi anaemia protein FANCD2, partial [Dimargaris cristalligena]